MIFGMSLGEKGGFVITIYDEPSWIIPGEKFKKEDEPMTRIIGAMDEEIVQLQNLMDVEAGR